MGKSNKSTGTQNKQPESTEQEKPHTNDLEKWIPATVVVAIITAIAYIVVALIDRSTAITTTLKPIEFTQTAEAFHTSVAMTVTVGAIQTQAQATNISLTAFSGTQTALAIEAEKENLSISASQTSEAQVFETQTAIALAIPAPTEIKPIKYEHVVEVGETLREISKKYFTVDFYSEAIGRANCKPSPIAGDILIIRYYEIQSGETLGEISSRFGVKVDFLRYINNLSDKVDILPVNQILILPGDCGD